MIMASEGDSRKLSDLRVVDLRGELDKRGLDKTGIKATLIERLQKALREEGFDPDDYQFESKPAKRPSISTRPDDSGEGDSIENSADQGQEGGEANLENMDVEQSLDEAVQQTPVEAKVESVTSTTDDSSSKIDTEKKEDIPKTDQPKEDIEIRTVISDTEIKPVEKANICEVEPSKKKAETVQEPESPINLTIEEEEENMVLHDPITLNIEEEEENMVLHENNEAAQTTNPKKEGKHLLKTIIFAVFIETINHLETKLWEYVYGIIFYTIFLTTSLTNTEKLPDPDLEPRRAATLLVLLVHVGTGWKLRFIGLSSSFQLLSENRKLQE